VSIAVALPSEADRVVDYWMRRGGVSMSQVEKAAGKPQTARVLIKDGEVS
jgi:ABC-type nitrate/sulfonate/bicarbonate transport system substrate-binding protein